MAVTSESTLRAERLDGIATHEILEGLARLHSLVVVSDLDGRIVWMSEDVARVCGGSRQHLGRDLRTLLAGIGNARVIARAAEQISHGLVHLRSHDSMQDVRFDLGRSSGPTRRIEVSSFRVPRKEAGGPLVVSIVHPADRHSRGDRVLRREIEALESILDSSPDVAMVVDRFGFISYVNPASETVLGVEREKLLEQPLALFLPRSADFVQLMADLSASSGLNDREIEIRRPDGSRLWISVSARSHRPPDGHGAHSIVFIRDVDVAVRRRLALERKNVELENYVNSVSHDLRSPLVSLLGFSRLLRDDYAHLLDDTGRHFVDRIERAGRTMESLIRDLLELSRGASNVGVSCLVDPRPVLLQIEAELKLRLDEQRASLEIPVDLPMVHCNHTHLYQIFSNLIGNALQHMGPCTDRRIEVSIATEAEQHVLCVTDRGQGISADEQERVFELFHSGGRTTEGRRSTGVGLAIVKKIAESYGGRVWVESAPRQGARFHVSLRRH